MARFEQDTATSDPRALISSTDDTSAWLDAVLLDLTLNQVNQLSDDSTGQRLRDIPLEAIILAVERAGPAISTQAQASLYKYWIEANQGMPPTLCAAAWFNMGVLLCQVGDNANAAAAYQNALVLHPELHAAAINLGMLFEATGNSDRALTTWQNALQPDEARISLLTQQGRLLESLGRLDAAEHVLRRVLYLDPDQRDVVHHWMHIRQKTCQWPVPPTDMPGLDADRLREQCGPFATLALTDDVDEQRTAAAAWIARKTQLPPQRLAPERPYRHRRIKIGYMSSDFCRHAMSYLLTELFERHDRQRFEVYGYCASREDGSPLRQRVLRAFDHHRFIRELSDQQAAQLIRDDEIDVLIDLNGITDGSRLAVLRWRPAPIQATYLGFVGPVPLPELDYLLCDHVVIPPEYEAAYEPTPLVIGPLFQANDSKRVVNRNLTRAQAGLPDDRFVLCCFSRHYKITEEMFAAWMSILRAAPRAVLWLAADNGYSEANLASAAGRAGIGAERLIIIPRTDPDIYMSLLGLADLYLDTFPYNAGTVASDAIRMQVPIVTLCGRSFASRMATSLLHALAAPQGIATSMSKYVEIASRLCNGPALYAEYKTRFCATVWQNTVGNISRFTSEFETTWCRVVRAAEEG